jgi:hypothetical protein
MLQVGVGQVTTDLKDFCTSPSFGFLAFFSLFLVSHCSCVSTIVALESIAHGVGHNPDSLSAVGRTNVCR